MMFDDLAEVLTNRRINHNFWEENGIHYVTVLGFSDYYPRSWDLWIDCLRMVICVYCDHCRLHAHSEAGQTVTFDLGTVFDLMLSIPDSKDADTSAGFFYCPYLPLHK
jgi:hypothetical protein